MDSICSRATADNHGEVTEVPSALTLALLERGWNDDTKLQRESYQRIWSRDSESKSGHALDRSAHELSKSCSGHAQRRYPGRIHGVCGRSCFAPRIPAEPDEQ